MNLRAAAIQMQSEPGRTGENLDRADAFLHRAFDQGAELAVLPEMFNTGYCASPDFFSLAEDRDGPTIRLMRERSRLWGMAIAGGFVEGAGGHLYDSMFYCEPDGGVQVYRKQNLVFWESSKFRRGASPLVVETRWGRVGFAICADMIYRRVWDAYRGAIDLAIVGAAWPNFGDRSTGRGHWLLGQVGPLAGQIPAMVADDLGIPVVFANQCGPTRTKIPVMMTRLNDAFAGRSALADGPGGSRRVAGINEEMILGDLTIRSERGQRPCPITYPSASVA
ncbi:carbon-nitrogen hydrolase family protein [Isosphaeraceae bacterium EP7]